MVEKHLLLPVAVAGLFFVSCGQGDLWTPEGGMTDEHRLTPLSDRDCSNYGLPAGCVLDDLYNIDPIDPVEPGNVDPWDDDPDPSSETETSSSSEELSSGDDTSSEASSSSSDTGDDPYDPISSATSSSSQTVVSSSSSVAPSSSSSAPSSSSVTPSSSSSAPVSSSSSSSSGGGGIDCSGLLPWDSGKTYNWVPTEECVVYNNQKYCHKDWCGTHAPGTFSAWTLKGVCL